MKNLPLLFLSLLFAGTASSQNGYGVFAETEFHVKPDKDAEELNFFAYLFETKKQLSDFIGLQKGDRVVEVGAGTGINLGVLSMLSDSVTFVAQDISTKDLNEKKFRKLITKYEKKRSTPSTNTFERVIGTKSSSNLPDNSFDKLFIINSFHDFDKQEEMLDDIYKKLKPDGQFILLEGFSFPADTQVCPDYGPHVLHTMDVDLATFERHGFYLAKMRAPYFKAAHYGNGLVLVKDKQRSEIFCRKKEAIDEVVSHAFRLKQPAIAGDSAVVTQIADSLLARIHEITEVYPVFEVWMKELGFRHFKKADYTAAIHVFKANTRLFPDSYQAWYWLGLAYEQNKNHSAALESYRISCKLRPENKLCEERMKMVGK